LDLEYPRRNALLKGAHEECIGGSSDAAAKDATIMLSKEECASGMGQVAYYAAVGCTSRCLNSAVCVKHGAHKTKLCSSE